MDKLHTQLQNVFGFERFRPDQKEAIETLLEKKKLLVILPTGYGKSLLYQLPATLLPNMTVVISPLLALMRDQLNGLEYRFGITSCCINSDQTEDQNEEVRQKIIAGAVKILFISPEQLDNLERFTFLSSLAIDLVVVDEAHCISTWGHDFRPSYRQIMPFVHAIEKKQPVMTLALTATANEETEKDIQKQLANVSIIRKSLDRPNLYLSVYRMTGIAQKLSKLKALVKSEDGSVLVYCATREHVELVTEFLQSEDIDAKGYHAGFLPEDKKALQNAFISDTHKVLVSTNALGMGIDKPNIRFIIHFDMPGSITAYYQEVGRAGRDGDKAHGALLYDPKDRAVQEYFISSLQPKKSDFDKVLASFCDEPLNLVSIKCKSGLHPTLCTVIVAELVEQKVLEKVIEKKKQFYQLKEKNPNIELSRYEQQYLIKSRELQKMIAYAEKNECLMMTLQQALGDKENTQCMRCSICKNETILAESNTESVSNWLSQRKQTIAPVKTYGLEEGKALFDSLYRAKPFVQFMKNRKEAADIDEELVNQVVEMLSSYKVSAIIPVPSRSWAVQKAFIDRVATKLGLQVFDILYYKKIPDARQGELFNNDQRRQNIADSMGVEGVLPHDDDVVLFDDYTGSGATFREAARALRKEGKVKNRLFPFAIATVRWRLGKEGFL